MKKVYFTQINNVIAEATFLPLSVAYVWEYCNANVEGWELGGILFERETVAEYLKQITDPDVFAISTYVWNWTVSQELARAIKQKYPNCLIVMGGPQVPYRQSWLEQNRDICDVIVTYAGERTFAELLRGSLTAPGIMTVDSYTVPKPDKLIEDIPSPYLSGLMNSLMKPNKQYSAIIETNRGCPYRCTFCDQEALYYNKIAKFNHDRVLSELDWVSNNKIEFLYFADSNLGIFERDLQFIHHLAKNKNATGYPRNIDYATAKQQPDRILELGRILNHEAKINRGMTIALQSMNPKTLDAIKRTNIANIDLEKTVQTYNKNNIENYCELILGLPEETFNSWISGIGKILELGSDHALTVHPLSIVPNTPFANKDYKEKYGLQYTPTQAPAGGNVYPKDSDGEIDYICYSSNTMTSEEWIDAYFFAKGIVIPHHYHGASQLAAEFLNRTIGVPLIEYYKVLFEHSKNGAGVLHDEYLKHTGSVRRSLFKQETWGRPVAGNFHFQDNGATAAMLYSNIDAVHNEIISIINNHWGVDISEVLCYNKLMLDTHNKIVTSLKFNYNWPKFFTTSVLDKANNITVKVETKQYKDLEDHAKHIFWYGRKSKRCFLKHKVVEHDTHC